MEDPEMEQTALFLWKAANSLSETCPAASRHYVSTLQEHIGSHALSLTFRKSCMYCKYCGSLWKHLNHKIRIQPTPLANSHIKKLMKLEKDQPWKLNNRQKKKLKKFRETTNKIIYTCNVCKKATTFPGLKKYIAKDQDLSINTQTPKVKLKKGDLNAGLFISTPTEKNNQKNSMKDIQDSEVLSQASSTLELMDSAYTNNKPHSTEKMIFASKIMKKNVTPQATSSSKKKKKGLLAQILNQEQEARQQKKTLSSFLTSM